MGTDSTKSTVCLTFDFDAISLWIGPFAARSPSMISRGEFGAVGARRILRLLELEGVHGTFFVTGHTAETYPEIVRDIVAAGHEIGHHGYLHENPIALETPQREREVLLRGLHALDAVAGVRPRGYRSPSWDNSPWTVELLVAEGFLYESSLMASDFTPYWCRSGDVIQADGPYLFGPEVDLVEMPVSWILDDFPHFENVSIPAAGINRPGLSAPSKVEEIWHDEFTYMQREVPNGVYTLTMHPQVIGRGHRMLLLERLIAWLKDHQGVHFSRLGDAAAEFRNNHPRQVG